MKFPYADNIEPYLKAIEGRSEFIVAKRDGYVVINYMVAFSDSFPDPELAPDLVTKELWKLRRNCRGIVFDSNGKVIAIRLHKFFNIGEKEETQPHNIDFSKPHKILAKLDGSMITPIILSGVVRYGTKMGLTDVAKPVEHFVSDKPYYNEFCKELAKQNLTPIFEWTSRKQRIVLDYEEDQLILLAIRHNFTGEYIDFDNMIKMTPKEIPIVKQFEGSVSGLQDLIEQTRSAENIEGFVVRFDDGQMYKLKSDWYLRIHKCKEALTFEKDVIEMLINDKADDVKPYLSESELKRLNEYERDFWTGIDLSTQTLNAKYFIAKLSSGDDKKKFAVEFANKETMFKAMLFKMWGGDKARDVIISHIKNNIRTQNEVNAIRKLFDAVWIEQSSGE